MRRVLYAAPISFERKQFERDVFIEELLMRLKLTFAGYSSAWNRFGVVSANNPTIVPQELLVFTDPDVAFSVSVNPGTAVFPNGEIIVIPEQLSRISVGNQAPGANNVIHLLFSEEKGETKLTRSNVLANTEVTYLSDPSVYVQSMDFAAWEAQSQDELQLRIPLALVGVNSDNSLSIDHTRGSLTTNRPWFSPVDIEHRDGLGTGVVTVNNVHGLSFNDLTAANKTIFQLLLDTGMIVAKDIAIAKVPGHMCVDEVPSAGVLVDTTGNITGVLGAYYFDLAKYPEQLVRVTNSNSDVNTVAEALDIAGIVVPRTNRVVILPDDEMLDADSNVWDLKVSYINVDALSPPTTPLITSPLVLASPSSGEESVFAGGLSIATPLTQVDFSDAGPFPLAYTTFMQANSFLYKMPQVLFCHRTVESMGTAVHGVELPQLGNATLKVGLTNAIANTSLVVEVQLIGTDSDGATISETLTFDSSWAQDLAPGDDSEVDIANSTMYQNTTAVFKTLLNVKLPNAPVAAGAQAAIQVWANINAVQTTEIADMLPLVDCIWDGTKIVKIEDIRPINTTLDLPRVSRFIDGSQSMALTHGLEVAQTLTAPLQPILDHPSHLHQMWTEDFNKPKMVSSHFGTNSPVTNVAEPLPAASYTSTSKIREGLGRRDIFVSRAIPVKPYTATTAKRLRFVPIGRGPFDRATFEKLGFRMWARVFGSSGDLIGWSKWFNVTSNEATSTLESPFYSLRIETSFPVSPNIVKYQYVVAGDVRGMAIIFELRSPPQPGNLIYDVGFWDEQAWA